MQNEISVSSIFLPAILFIGVVTTYEDIKTSKIRNRWILLGLIYSLFVYSIAWSLYFLIAKDIVKIYFAEHFASSFVWYFDKWCINLVISTLVAYAIWRFKMWGAGDAKLFIVFASLIPMRQYSKVYFNYNFASFLLLLNIFIPATVYFIIKAFFYFFKINSFSVIKETMLKLLKEKSANFKIFEAIKVLLGFFCFFLFFRILRQELVGLMNRFIPDQNIIVLISLLVFKRLSNIFKKEIKFIILFFIILGSYIVIKVQDSGAYYLFLIANSMHWTILIMLLFPIINKIIKIYDDNTSRKSTPFAMWMFIGALITWFI